MLSIYYSVGRGSMDAMFPHFVCDGVCSRSVEKVQTWNGDLPLSGL